MMSAKKIRISHKVEKTAGGKSTSQPTAAKPLKTIKSSSDSVLFRGYDKTAVSDKETVHIINRTGDVLKELGIEITYLDLKGRMLHSRTLTLSVDIPPGETRKADFPSWDVQHTFYYHRSTPPRRKAAPYKVVLKLLWLKIDGNGSEQSGETVEPH